MAAALDRERLRRLGATLEARASYPPPPDRIPLIVGGRPCGTVGPDPLHCLLDLGGPFRFADHALLLDDAGTGSDPFERRSRALESAALALRAAGLLPWWRDELLEVRPAPDGAPLAVIERAACRALGITTYAVHANGFLPGGELVVCRRAPDKSVDPGLWDNIAAGMIAAGESELEALAREAQEEVGLDIGPLMLVRGGRLRVGREVPEGYMSEWIQVFDIELPPRPELRNQDGEVDLIETRRAEHAVSAIERGEFTLEASLVTVEALERRLAVLPFGPRR
jgi:8-oxo-dGTP pyrophosphatase MutT (NUDIX family)